MSEIAASAVGGSIGLVGDLATTGLNRLFYKKDRDWNKKYEQEIYNRNRADYLSDLQSEREYNSAQAQINRLRDAGINPNLANGGALTSGQSSAAQMQSFGGFPASDSPAANFGSAAGAASAIASGVAASSNAEVNQRKADIEITNIKLSNDYKKIENEFLRAEKELSLEKGRQSVNESIAKCKDYASQISLRDSSIILNGKKVNLVDKQADLAVQEKQLAAARTALTNLDAKKLELMMPYVQAYEESRLVLMNANSDLAKEQAHLSYQNACVSALTAAKEQGLLDAGIVDEEIARIKAVTYNTQQEGKYVKKRANAQMMQSVGSMVQGIGNVCLGAAGVYLGTKVPKVSKAKPYTNGTIISDSYWHLD